MSRLARENPEDERYQTSEGQREASLEITENGKLIDPGAYPECKRRAGEGTRQWHARLEGWLER